MKQQSLTLRCWGGRRRGAGRRPAGAEAQLPHVARERFHASQPVHVTLEVRDHVWNLRSERSFTVVHGAVSGALRRPDFRVNHFSIQGDHFHLIVEADGVRSLSSGVRALSIRLARRLNHMMGRSGPVFEDRFHAHVLRTPAEVRNAVRYVLGNHANHMRRKGLQASLATDPFSSAAGRPPRGGQLDLFSDAATRPARTWLLRQSPR